MLLQIQEQAVSIFNAKFEPYIGDKQNATQVRSLIAQVNSSNASSANQVTLTGITSLKEVQQTKTYTVTVEEYWDENTSYEGAVKTIAITSN